MFSEQTIDRRRTGEKFEALSWKSLILSALKANSLVFRLEQFEEHIRFLSVTSYVLGGQGMENYNETELVQYLEDAFRRILTIPCLLTGIWEAASWK